MAPDPLGPPIRADKVAPVEQWRALDPSKPWIQTNTLTGMLRNVKPPPVAPSYPWFGITGAEEI